MRTFLALLGIACMLLGLGSCAIGGAGGLAAAVATSTIGTVLFGTGAVTLGLATVVEELQGLRKHFERRGKPPTGSPGEPPKEPYREI